MAFDAKVYRILIASPSDVSDERRVASEMLHWWNASYSYTTRSVMLPVMWETHAAPRMGDRPQGILNSQLVDQCDALIGIFWTRIGTPTGQAESGSVEEIRRFIAAKKPSMLYFSSIPVVPDNLDREQLERLMIFRRECESTGGLVDRFDALETFRLKLAAHLASLSRELIGIETETISAIQLPRAGPQGTVLQAVTDGVWGVDYPKSHA